MDRKSKIVIAVVAVIAVAALAFFGIRNQMRKTTTDENVIKIGVVLPLTGFGAHNGEMVKNGFDLAQSEINASNDLPKIQVFYEDNKTSPKDAITAFKKLEAQGIKFIAVQGGPSSMAIAPLTKDKNILLFGVISTEEMFVKVTNKALRICPRINEMASVIADFDKRELKANRAAIIFMADEYGSSWNNAFKKEFIEKGGTIVAEESYSTSQKDFKDILSRISLANADVIHFVGVGNMITNFAKQCAENPKTAYIPISGDITFAFPTIKKELKHIKNDVYFVDGVISDTFISKYQQAYGKEYSSYSAYAYIVPLLLKDAVKATGTQNPQETHLYLLKNRHDTAVGDIIFFPDGNPVIKLVVHKIEK